MDDVFGAELGAQMRTRKLLDPSLRKTEVRENPELPGVEARDVEVFFVCLEAPVDLMSCIPGSNAIPHVGGGLCGGGTTRRDHTTFQLP